MTDDAKTGTFGWENKPLPDSIQKRKLDDREIDYTKFPKAPVGGQINLRGDSQVGISGATVNILPNIQQFLGDSGTYFSKSLNEDNYGAVDVNNFTCDCGRKDSFKVIKTITENRSKIVKCLSCNRVYGFIPEAVYNIISSPAASLMTPQEISIILARQPRSSKYIIFERGN